MTTRTRLNCCLAITLISMSLVTGTLAHDDTKSAKAQRAPANPSQSADAGSGELHRVMMAGVEQMQQMKPTGDLDKDFAMMMRMHHQQAVQMAKTEAQNGKSAELKALANKMMADQQKEIGQLEAWLQKHK